jgi:hypothetical protein
MSRLRYPFTEISAKCRLCGATGFTASSEHALGGRLIDWRREHAKDCVAWPTWAEQKGLKLDPNGALLYGSEEGPYEPKVRTRSESEGDASEADEVAEALAAFRAEEIAEATSLTYEPIPLLLTTPAAPERVVVSASAPARERVIEPVAKVERVRPVLDLMLVPESQLAQSALF